MKEVRFYQSIQVKLIVIYVLLILVAMQLIGVYFVRTMENSFREAFSTSMMNQADLIAEYVKPILAGRNDAEEESEQKLYHDLSTVVNNFNTFIDAEIQIIDANGHVLSSSLNQTIIGQKSTQAEVSRVLLGIEAQPEYIIDELGVRKQSLVVPINEDGKIIGAVYVVASLEDLYGTMNNINRIFIAGTMIALALTALLGVILSNTITAPIKEITRTATEMAEGNFSRQLNVVGKDEIGQLGNAFNYMTDRLKEALSVNEEERDKLASILANMSDGVIATDDEGKVMVINSRAKQMLRVEESSVIGIELTHLLGIPKGEIDRYVLGENRTDIVELPFREDEVIIVRVTFTPIHRRGKGISGTIIVLQDITEQEQLEQSRRDFVANVSHELRTPLTTINSYLEALDDGALEDPDLAKRFVGVTRNETERMIRLVSDLLHLSRLDARQTELQKEPTDIVGMLEDVADRFSFQLRQKKIDIVIRLDDKVKPIPIDSDQIDQVLDNLLSNAVKYTPEGGSIEIALRKKDPMSVEVSVQDTGIGIPQKDLNRIFERFYRVDKARSRSMGGTGLGLSIAREIIKAHDGDITIESEWNKGTRVSFTLPLEPRESDKA